MDLGQFCWRTRLLTSVLRRPTWLLDTGKLCFDDGARDGPERCEQSRSNTPPRIVVVTCVSGPLECCEVILRQSYQDAELALFEDSEEAWQHLSKNDPDLLITGTWFPRLKGKEIVERLMDRKAAIPMIVISTYDAEELWVREYASRGLNIRFRGIPFELASFRSLVEGSLIMFSVPRLLFREALEEYLGSVRCDAALKPRCSGPSRSSN